MVTKKCSWRKSQSSSGYYQTGKNHFINFRRNDNGYDVELREGLGHPSKYRVIAKGRNKAIALKKARAYMKRENKC